MLVTVIEPDKCIIDDLEVLAFENEEQLNFYTVWHEALFDKRRELNAESERERQIIKDEIIRKTHQLIGEPIPTSSKKSSSKKSSSKETHLTANSATSKKSSAASHEVNETTVAEAPTILTKPNVTVSRSSHRSSKDPRGASRVNPYPAAQSIYSSNQDRGLVLHNSSQYGYNTLPDGRKLLRYKLNKMYNKYRGRQQRRNHVIEKQLSTKIDEEIRKSYLNPWLAYCALQALRLPPELYVCTDINNFGFGESAASLAKKKKKKKVKDPSQVSNGATASPLATSILSKTATNNQPPFNGFNVNPIPQNFIYVDPSTVITYSNRINPQQVAEYRQKAHLLPNSATSKKSSAASYDVYEIMEVLANTNKTNVTISRNSHRPNPNTGNARANPYPPGQSIYSHSINTNTPGIVSTQLHHQARSYLDSMSKFYAEERQRIKEEEERLKNEPSPDEFIDDFFKKHSARSILDYRHPFHHPQAVSSGIDPDLEHHD